MEREDTRNPLPCACEKLKKKKNFKQTKDLNVFLKKKNPSKYKQEPGRISGLKPL